MEENIKQINKNMIRERAEKLPEVTEDMYLLCNQESRELIAEFNETHPLLSPDTKTQYKSATRQFLWWTHVGLKDKPFYKITKREFSKYMSYLINHGLSSSGIKFKKSAISTICDYAESMLAEEDDNYKTFHNFTKIDMKIPKNNVYSKIPISEEEYKKLIDELFKREEYLALAWVSCAFATASRRGGIRQFKTSILEQEIKDGQQFIYTNIVREKGQSVDGKQVKYLIPVTALYYMKLWVEKRGYEHEYIFTTKYGGKIKPISRSWANNLCSTLLSDILGRRINPHLFKSSSISYYLAQGMDLKFVSKNIAMHNDISTTSNFYDLRTFDDEKNDMFSKIKF